MNKRFSISVLVVGIFAMLASAIAQTPPPAAKPDMSVEEIVKKSLEATGPEAARDKVKSRVAKATIEIPAQGITGTGEIYEKAPNKSLSILNINGVGEIIQGCNGKIAWAKDPFTGLREKSGGELMAALRDADSDGEANWKKYFTSAEVVGTDKVGDNDVYVVTFKPAEGNPTKKYYDKKTFFLVREDETIDGPQGAVPVSIYFSDFRDVEGVKFPFVQRQEAGGATIFTKITEVKQNVAIDDAKFEKPLAS